ncbi:isoprenyl transferase [Chromobacterium haemolyticum]|uniref:Isoprenyl transferase n=2 Tax=Chromobacterium haemolyticum TaxID=394935 RepID=A0ABS3GT91_9NEIS|nr:MULTISPECIES: isoprenyl transferase [Chromobacterium]MBK0417140.1 isoprenyl transferase [Chromobacterium haemolyticum]MBO0418266.1 isoprenyl transferase [Chromobacterium haemolyticum]MBO0501591.1 isoprenyl transferase [Chromobacterium haemolyticum]BBH12354.1 isoprenyl transferase [Chromobacterium haemolyticum]
MFASSTKDVPEVRSVPRHIAIIMDGNGRWAKKRFLPRVAGHKRGLDTVREIVGACKELGVECLTLFAFSTENWRRPQEEVSFLMDLFIRALEHEVSKLHSNNIRLRVLGSRERFSADLQERILRAEEKTAGNDGLALNIAADYGGRWDILNAVNSLIAEGVTHIGEEALTQRLSMPWAPEPDLFIRTGGEQRISNFLLWQLAYSELYFTETLWPDFDRAALEIAIGSYQCRERRFGRTSEQLPEHLRRDGR